MTSAPTFGSLNGDTVTFTEDGAAVLLDSGTNATVTDTDSANFNTGSLRVAITTNRVTSEDVLAIVNQGVGAGQIGVSGSNVTYGGVTIGTFTGGTGSNDLVVSLNSSATPTATQALVRDITYANTNTGNPSTSARTVSFVLTDDQGNASSASLVTANVTAVNDAPVATASSGSTKFLEANVVNGTAVAVDSAITVADVDNATLASATVSITGGLQTAEDVLAFTSGAGFGNITGSYASGTGILTLTSAGATATVAQWQAALESITYRDTAGSPNTASRTISFIVNDGALASSTVTKTIAFDLSNAAPTQTVPATQSTLLNTNLVLSTGNSNKISVADADAGGSVVQATLSVGHGTLTLSGVAGLAFTSGSGTGDATMIFTGTLANINTALDGMTYAPTTSYSGADSLSVTVNDQGNTGSGGAKSSTTSLAINVLPTTPLITDVTSTSANTTYRSGDSVTVQVTFDRAVTVNTAGGTPALLMETGDTDHSATYISGSGTNVLTFRYDVQSFDVTTDLDYQSTAALALNGATIRSTSTSVDSSLTLPAIGGSHSISGQKDIVIDAVPDVFTSTNSDGGNTILLKTLSSLTSLLGTLNVDTVVYSGPGPITLPDTIENLTLKGGSTAAVTGNYLTNKFDLTAAGTTTVDGGASVDNAFFNGKMSTYLISQVSGGYQVTSPNGSIATLKNIELISFSDGFLHTDYTAEASTVFSLYTAAFDRYADFGGETYWLTQYKSGISLLDIAGTFAGSAEFRALFGVAPTDTDYVKALYKNVLGRDPDAGGQTYWVDALSHGTSRAQMLINFAQSGENQADLVPVIGQGVLVGPAFP